MFPGTQLSRCFYAIVIAAALVIPVAHADEYSAATFDINVDPSVWGAPSISGDTISFTVNATEYAKFGVLDLWSGFTVTAHGGYVLDGNVLTSINGSYDFSGTFTGGERNATLGSGVMIVGDASYLGGIYAEATTTAQSGSGTLTSSGAETSSVILGKYGTLGLTLLVTAGSSPTGATATIETITYTPVTMAVSAVPEADSAALLAAGLGMIGFLVRRRQPQL